MTKSLLLVTILFFLTACSSHVSEATSNESGTSTVDTSKSETMTLEKPDPRYEFMNKESVSASNDAYCAELSRKIQALKGKPQRHHAAQQRYDLECKR